MNALALLKFSPGVFVLEGKVLVDQDQVFLAVNQASNSESIIKLNGPVPKELLKQNGSNAAIKLKITKSFFSRRGEAQFISLKKYLSPFDAPLLYQDERSLPRE